MVSPPPPTEGNALLDDIPKNSPEYSALSGVVGERSKDRPKIAIFASGRGTDFQAIIDSNQKGEVDLNIALLLCNRPEAFVIQRAKDHSIPYVIIDHRNKEREVFDHEIHDILADNGIELIVLAGFMRVLSPWFVKQWKDRIVNIHPALLPSFPGAHAHRDALEHGVKVTGLTVHFVDEEVDHGPIIFQHPVMVWDDDDEDTLSKRVLEQEHIWYPRVIQWIADGKVKRTGRKVMVNKGE